MISGPGVETQKGRAMKILVMTRPGVEDACLFTHLFVFVLLYDRYDCALGLKA